MTKYDSDSYREKKTSARKAILVPACLVGFLVAWIVIPFLISVETGVAMVAFLGVGIILVLGAHLWCRGQRERVFGARDPMSNERFLEEMGATKDKGELFIAVRKAFAIASETEPENLYPDDTAVWLGNMLPAPLDSVTIMLELEDRLDIHIADELMMEIFFNRSVEGSNYNSLSVKSFALNFIQAFEEGRHMTKQAD